MITWLRFRIISFFWIFLSLMRQVSLLLFLPPRQGMHPLISLVTLTLRRMNLLQDSSCYRVSPRSSRHPRAFWCNRTWCDRGTWRHRIRRTIHHCWARLGHNPFSFFLFFGIFNNVDASSILTCASAAWPEHPQSLEMISMTFAAVIWDADDPCFLVSMYLILIFGSKLIRSNNQSRATRWVLETCLIVELLPLIIILITASLSSNTYNKASWCENWTFEGTQSIQFQNVDHSLRSLIWPVIFVTVHNGLLRSIMGLNCVSKD